VNIGPRVEDFVTSDPGLLAQMYGAAPGSRTLETLLVQQHGADMDLSLYLDGDVLQRCLAIGRVEDLQPSQIADFCIALEGVSHFVYLIWKATRQVSVTLLELEIQAEVDKFLTLAKVLGAQAGVLPESLRAYLFERVSFAPHLDGAQLQRYQDANRYAGRFCWQLERSLRTVSGGQALNDARRFYRWGQHQKIASLQAH
jgi:hypothetical protein